jgi:hypothetical protein
MRAPVVEIADVLDQDLLQMALIEYEDVLQAFGPDRSHPALGDGDRDDLSSLMARGDLNGVRTWRIPIFRTRRSKVASMKGLPDYNFAPFRDGWMPDTPARPDASCW